LQAQTLLNMVKIKGEIMPVPELKKMRREPPAPGGLA
jgi:hypothetical protein